MPVEIGKAPANLSENPIQVMHDCHRRIERFLYVIVTIKRQAQGGLLSPEQRSALGAALRYFREAAPWHVLDEQESLFPRLRGARKTDPSTSEVLGALELEHAVVQACHREMDFLGRKWLDQGSLSATDTSRFTELIRKLCIIYHHHIHEEESRVFPLAEKVLLKSEIFAIGQEMAARRQVPFVYEMMANLSLDA